MKLNASKPVTISRIAGLLASLFLATPAAFAVDGVIEINQARAFAGGVTSGDTPGFPVTLSQPGSYRLTGNLATASRAVTAILVTADDVSIDLNGFTIACTFATGAIPVGCLSNAQGEGDGIAVDGVSSSDRFVRTTVTNGVIRDMGSDGVRVGAQSRVANLQVVHNGRFGIFAASGSIITANIVNRNGNIGILVEDSGLVIGNTIEQNGGFGLSSSQGVGYKDNILGGNTGNFLGPQVNGGTEIGVNICHVDTTCP